MKLLRLSFFGLMLLLQGCPVSPFPRTAEFQARAQAGQPLVRAIEAFRKDTGRYPASLAELAPKYLPEVASEPGDLQHKFSGWKYYTFKNGATDSYSLDYFMGKGGVRYTPPRWVSNDDGYEKVISIDQ